MSKKFPWGRIIDRHQIGPYEFVEYHPHAFVNGCGTSEIDESKRNFQGYINGEDTRQSWASLDEALAGVIVCRSLGFNFNEVSEHFIAGIRALATPDGN